MGSREDEPGNSRDKDSGLELNTGKTEAPSGPRGEQDGRSIVSYLPTTPVIADAGTTRSIEGTAQPGQILPFESQVQGHIGRQLRALYDHVLDQPIPDRFLALLSQLDESGGGGVADDGPKPPLIPDVTSTDPKGGA